MFRHYILIALLLLACSIPSAQAAPPIVAAPATSVPGAIIPIAITPGAPYRAITAQVQPPLENVNLAPIGPDTAGLAVVSPVPCICTVVLTTTYDTDETVVTTATIQIAAPSAYVPMAQAALPAARR